MTEKDTGGLAFPSTEEVIEASAGHQITKILSGGGMTLRQWYAGKALPTILEYSYSHGLKGEQLITFVTESAYIFADAMITQGKL